MAADAEHLRFQISYGAILDAIKFVDDVIQVYTDIKASAMSNPQAIVVWIGNF